MIQIILMFVFWGKAWASKNITDGPGQGHVESMEKN